MKAGELILELQKLDKDLVVVLDRSEDFAASNFEEIGDAREEKVDYYTNDHNLGIEKDIKIILLR